MPEAELDQNQIIASFWVQSMGAVFETGLNVLKGGADKVKLKLKSTYNEYLHCVWKRHSVVKTFFFRSEPTHLYNFYVPVSVESSKSTIEKPTITSLVKTSSKLVVIGLAGSGKSMLMRHLLLSSIVEKTKVPVFVELRELNFNGKTLRDTLTETLNRNSFKLDDCYIEKALKDGHFILFFDGFDEVDVPKRVSVSQQILELTQKYDKNLFLISSRPDPELEALPGFSVFKIKPLSQGLAVDLIRKLDYDPDLKKAFIQDLEGSLFKKHSSFLSNPLLLTIMLLSYSQSAQIPEKLNLFYSQAFEALFQRHDTLKAGYKRHHHTDLDIQEFSKLFSGFCMVTYDEKKISLERSEVLKYLEAAKRLTSIECDAEKFLADAMQSVCLLIEDGVNIVFTHRSFQEYFVAVFISELGSDAQGKLIKKYSKYVRVDSVFLLLYEIRPEVVEKLYILPSLNHLFNVLNVKDSITHLNYLNYFKRVCIDFSFENSHLRTITLTGNFWDEVSFAVTACRHYLPKEDAGVKVGMGRYPGIKTGTISVKTLTVNSNFFKWLVKTNHFAAVLNLEAAWLIRYKLIEKNKSVSQSLEEILFTTKVSKTKPKG